MKYLLWFAMNMTQWLTLFIQRQVIHKAAYSSFEIWKRRYPEWYTTLFDSYFLTVYVVLKLYDYANQQRQLSAEELVMLWSDQLQSSSNKHQDHVAQMMPAAIDFLYLFETELAHHWALMEPYSSLQSNAVGPMFPIISEAS